jgi:hypothetical protein
MERFAPVRTVMFTQYKVSACITWISDLAHSLEGMRMLKMLTQLLSGPFALAIGRRADMR